MKKSLNSVIKTCDTTWRRHLWLKDACKRRMNIPSGEEVSKRVTPLIFLPRTICNQLFGTKHPFIHRFIAGLIIAACGVYLADYCKSLHNELYRFSGDVFGMGLHGIGITPVIEKMAKQAV